MATARAEATRRYGPLLGIGLSLLLVVTVLPSALNVPLSNPTTTPEFAPVPPGDDDLPPDVAGNLASIGTAAGFGVGAAGGGPGGPAPGTDADAAAAGGVDVGLGLGTLSKNPSDKLCVGNPPRQTEDPLSPPCVAFFRGDNGGATHAGVTPDEIRVLVYVDGYPANSRNPSSCGKYFDTAKPMNRDNGDYHHYIRALQRHFNARYQTYGRYVHVFIQTSRCDYSVESRRADAVEGARKIKPFAAFLGAVLTNGGNGYLEQMTAEGVVTFLSTASGNPPKRAKHFRDNPGLVWSYSASLEHKAALYADYVCAKVVPHPVSFSGNALDDGRPRVLGQLYAVDPDVPELAELSKLVEARIRGCGGRIALVRTTSKANTARDTIENGPADATGEAARNMAAFKQAGVTTILWTGLVDITHSRASAAIDYRPEWVVIGLGNMDSNEAGSLQQPEVWQHAWTVTEQTYIANGDQTPCLQAAREADPTVNPRNARYECGFLFPTMRQIFSGIQLAGPRLTPRTMDTGFHAIPRIASTSLALPACFYEPGDYTCVKDAVAARWDPNGPNQGAIGQPGCYRIPQASRRHLRGTWPAENVNARQRPDDYCNMDG